VTATVQGTTLGTTFAATIGGPAVATCNRAADSTALAVGQAVSASGTSLCAAGGTSGAEYALIPFNASPDARSRASLTVQSSGTAPASAPLADRAPFPGASVETPQSLRAQFESRLRERAALELQPMMSDARAWYAARTAAAPNVRRSVIPSNVQVGQLVRLNAHSDDPCTNPDFRTGRVEAISSRAIVIADTLNPTGGYTTADYQSIAVTFDTLVDAIDTKNFGQPSDIDANGHIVMFFTSAVNALTPRNSSSYIGGFFDSRDLFPTTTTNSLKGCAGSNVGEMFYLLVPDPTGMVNGNRFSKTFVSTVTITTTAHEYQHLINSSRRLYVNNASAFETTWLDEGLAHVAEELQFYARAHLGPGQNIDAAALRSSSLVTNAFGDAGIDNFDRLALYLQNPLRNSPYADNDSLETRGATWSFLRYAADQVQPSNQEVVWNKLVNTTAVGMANLQQAFGDTPSLFRDWATMLMLDDIPGASARYQLPSWNLRSVFAIPSVSGGYPLRTTPLTSGSPTTVTLPGGSAGYLRFAVAPRTVGAVGWSTLPSGVSMTLVRIR
jgi:hypothetical protein